MERFTISLDDKLAQEFDALITGRGYATRSEAVRDLIRAALESDRQRQQQAQELDAHCVANLSYVFNHHERELAERLTALQHDHHDLTVAAMHSHLDHEHCLESVILRGPTSAVRRFTDAMIAERGVHHGQVNLIGMTVDAPDHHHHPHDHTHPHEDHPATEAAFGQHVHYRPAC